MRIKGSLVTGAFLALSLALIPNNAVAAQKLTPGSPCKVLNQKVISQNKTHTCVESGKKLIWNKGVAVVKPITTSTQAATITSTVTATPTQVAAPALETEPTGPTCSRNKNALKNC